MRTKLLLFSILFTLVCTFASNAQVPDRKGLWKFDDAANLLKAAIGTDLTLTGTETSVNGPAAGNLATQIGKGSYLTMKNGLSPNGGGTLVNEWSLQIDFSVPTIVDYAAFFQTDTTNTSDADLFVHHNDGSIGTSRTPYSANFISADTWHRMVVTVKQGAFWRMYLDGVLWLDTPDLTNAYFNLDGRWALAPKLLLFADNDGDDGLINCSEVAIWDVALNAAQVEQMGNATSTFETVAQVPVEKGLWKFDDPANLLKASVGTDLALTGTQTSVNGPEAGNGATQIGKGSYLIMKDGLAPNGGGTLVNEWSLQIDFSVPNIIDYAAFFQTDTTNISDADLFVHHNDGSIGTTRTPYSTKFISANTWYRMVVTVKQGVFWRMYINGELWLDTPDLTNAYFNLDGRWALAPKLLLFADNDGDDGLISCSEVAIWDVALDAAQVAVLGKSATIPTAVQKIQLGDNAQLGQNYPNPFTHSTILPYQIAKTGNVSFQVFDITGHAVRLINEGVKLSGKYTLELAAENLINGIYFVQMRTKDQVFTRKMILNK